ncbi:unnamed protein product [Sphenostylis stenocarpa]|uniref:Uncharacterized protein n=1 Tax=Sphenostylis stenocarpa TaxID=92480 RepID=A0AA86VYF8_9FABA|nr:unnamed protein product [Sphenostylis stenocarpa]
MLPQRFGESESAVEINGRCGNSRRKAAAVVNELRVGGERSDGNEFVVNEGGSRYRRKEKEDREAESPLN